MILFLTVLWACGPSDDRGSSTPTVEPQRSCAPQLDNVLRFDCTFALDDETGILVQVLADGAEVRRFDATAPARSHDVTLWGLEAERTYTVRVTPSGRPEDAWEEEITTAALPEVVDVTIEITGTPTVEHVMFPFQCGGNGHLVLARAADGALVWYQDAAVGTDLGNNIKIDGFEYDAASETVEVLIGHLGMREFELSGDLLREVGKIYGLEKPTHHDAHRLGEHAFALNASSYEAVDGTYVMDGVYVFDVDGNVAAEWELHDHVTPAGGGFPGGYWSFEFPGAIDFSHTNNVFVGDDGDWILSIRALDTVVKVRGDLDAPDFGEILWAMTTSGTSAFESDFTLVSSEGLTDRLTFVDQHHANLDDDGHLLLFDNGRSSDVSRGLDLVLDEETGTADIVDVWELDEHCPIQGAIFRLPSGNVLLTCPTLRKFFEFEPRNPEPVFTMQAVCAVGDEKPLVVRGQPVFLD